MHGCEDWGTIRLLSFSEAHRIPGMLLDLRSTAGKGNAGGLAGGLPDRIGIMRQMTVVFCEIVSYICSCDFTVGRTHIPLGHTIVVHTWGRFVHPYASGSIRALSLLPFMRSCGTPMHRPVRLMHS